jgi:hypothetical protein
MKAQLRIIDITLVTMLVIATFSTAANAGINVSNGVSLNGTKVGKVSFKSIPFQHLEVKGGELLAVLYQ